ncbi:SAF domain-containing protein [Isoptericola sp. NPDC058082]|uniref:SAF domain-containing protein n=1 Tax=Isoptericola sp. NPDC058082 TaxID=3346331 RepID=UPI0036E97675
MTTTTPVPENTRARSQGSADPSGAPAGQIAPPPKMRRRPALIALSVVLVCVGALVSAFAFQSMSNSQEVLTVRETIHRGQVIDADDLVTVRIGMDPALQAVPASSAEAVVGKHAALDIVAGGVVTAEQVTDAAVPSAGNSVVGVSVTAAMLPAGQVRSGDDVRIVSTTAGGGDAAEPAAVEGVVVGVTTDTVTGNTLVNVQVSADDAPQVASASAEGSAAIVVDSQE